MAQHTHTDILRDARLLLESLTAQVLDEEFTSENWYTELQDSVTERIDQRYLDDPTYDPWVGMAVLQALSDVRVAMAPVAGRLLKQNAGQQERGEQPHPRTGTALAWATLIAAQQHLADQWITEECDG